ncbi:NAD(P)H-binding protein [Pontibacter mangrovi]|uniref:NAD-dependent epimerase/dehydratase family protein n=1 Tax=Pontibacter mangrovi TaxID=2589816 RepID=A0A501W4Z7_9BACT|nr:NAD(P)H-binding protein [Pontibacter mangrovi]TPE43735.1 NAD-dependent epimerase/dehydratase family protein [Pontibacter mangrovi]
MQKVRTALIVGASGLVGGHLLSLLLRSERYSQVISVGRHELPLIHPKLDQQVIDFDKMKDYAADLVADDVFCCLGTTIKKAGSKEKFYKVDHTYITQLAEITARKGAMQFLVVSAMGADAGSMFFYNKVKGQMERDVQQQPFNSIHIFRPSLLLGEREEKRAGEELAAKVLKPLSAVFIGPLERYKPIEAETVARAMLAAAKAEKPGKHIHPSNQIARLGS